MTEIPASLSRSLSLLKKTNDNNKNGCHLSEILRCLLDAVGFAKINTYYKYNNFRCSFDSFWIHMQPNYVLPLAFSFKKTAICRTLLENTSKGSRMCLHTRQRVDSKPLTLLISRPLGFS